ncbi:hypothetical protein QQ008_14130 [Fulvivirgaceae bacterium BMA10]|uniref:Uncharacterized protein n=1 Tax=Splendidivirga corallicola TaxID=3051826 RepID=A0ABT8KP69_9BACT|nr:hypothetical protein [Fulvivirgaceae bacterium BMA10]
MKYLITFFFKKTLLLSIIALSLTQLAWSQDEDNTPVLELSPNTNTLRGDVIYGRHFIIRGSTKQPFKKNADLIHLRIRKKGATTNKFEGFWWRTEDGDKGNDFEFYINTVLEFETDYVFSFAFYRSKKIEEGSATAILNAVKAEYEQMIKNQESFELTAKDIQESINIAITSFLRDRGIYTFEDSLNLSQSPQIDVSEVIEESALDPIANQIRNIDDLLIINENIISYEKKIRKYILDGTFRKAGERLASLNGAAGAPAPGAIGLGHITATTITTADCNALINLSDVAGFKAIDFSVTGGDYAPVFQILGEIDAGTVDVPSDVSMEQSTTFKFIADMMELQGNLLSNETEKSRRVGLLDTEATKLESELDKLLGELTIGLKALNSYETQGSTTPSTKEAVEAIRIGTTFGGSIVFLDVFGQSRQDAISYVGLKFFLSPVDKRIADPYIGKDGIFKKTSILVGFQTGGDLNYKGQELLDAVGIKPILGFSYDINRYISVDIGSIFFIQPSISPLTNSEELKSALIVGISLDADALNRFRALFTSDNYKINPK